LFDEQFYNSKQKIKEVKKMSGEKKLINQESMVTLAAVQFEPKIGFKDDNMKRSLELIEDAAKQGANLIVLPEMCNTGYIFDTREECFAAMERIPEGPSTQAWMKAAKELNVYICAGIGEIDAEGKAYNACVLVGPDGYIGTHRKIHLWNDDKVYFEPGNLGYQVFHTPIGRIAMIICFDMWYFESFRILSMMGADIVCCPTNWVDGYPVELNTLGPHLCLVNSSCNNIFIVAADRIGTERECTFPGKSCITGPEGWWRAGPASFDQEEILTATVNLMEARRLNWNLMNVVHRDRRVDLYDEMLGSGMPKMPR
jgi:predicted amidohydrolase